MTTYELLQVQLKSKPQTWLVTGVAGFIGSNLLETLLMFNQKVIGLDNFITGYQRNLDEVKQVVTLEQWKNFKFTFSYDVSRSSLKYTNPGLASSEMYLQFDGVYSTNYGSGKQSLCPNFKN